ncbi:MAG: Crp/Fnr family transcriptional regulator [Bauldia sp.]|nr:Crp/Fnr family transcriptional regulator [Bauldia sp.]
MPTRTRASFAPLLARGWLSQQAPAFQGQLLDRLSLTIFPSGATIYTPGDPPGGIYGLIRGSIGVTIAPGKAGPHLAHVAVPGSWFGEGSFLTGRPRRVGLEAATECVLAYLALADMEKLVGGDPEVMRAFAAIAMINIDMALRAVEDLLIADPERRVAAVLWRASGGQAGQSIPMTQADLGHLANASRKFTLQALKALTGRGLLRQGYRHIDILEPERLRGFADGEA